MLSTTVVVFDRVGFVAGPSIALLTAMMAWVSQITGLPAAPVPRVVLADHDPYDRHIPIVHSGRYADRDKHYPGALTYPPGVVYLHPAWSAGDPVDYCLLAHEITHVLQMRAGGAGAEPQAYFVEAYCLALHKLDFWQIKGITPADIPGLSG